MSTSLKQALESPMKTVKITVAKLVAAYNACEGLGIEDRRGTFALDLVMLQGKLEFEYEAFTKVRDSLVERFAFKTISGEGENAKETYVPAMDERGKPIPGSKRVDPAKLDAFNAEFTPVLEREVEVQVTELKAADIQREELPAGLLKFLRPFISYEPTTT